MRDDILKAFCDGKRPKDLIKENIANRKTIYYYHSIFANMKEIIQSDEFINQMIKLMINLRIKKAKQRLKEMK